MDRGLARILLCIRRDNDGHVVIIITITRTYILVLNTVILMITVSLLCTVYYSDKIIYKVFMQENARSGHLYRSASLSFVIIFKKN